MCQFASWVEKHNKVYFLTGEQIFSPEGQKKLKILGVSPDDYLGHGTIRAYYGIDAGDGIDKECSDFSTPKNFPDIIVNAIKKGKMRGVGIDKLLLAQQAWAEYEKVKQPVFWDLFANAGNRAEAWR